MMSPTLGKDKKWRREIPLFIMLIPATILVLIFSYGPMMGLVIAFQKYVPTKGLFGSEGVGLKNFENLFSLPNFASVVKNTVFIALFKMIGGVLVPVLFALLLNELNRNSHKRILQTMVYLPHFLSWVILAGILKDLLSANGAMNNILSAFNIKPIRFLSDPSIFPITMIISEIWKSFGFGSVIYLAALTAIDQNLYEAARIDGANRIQQTLHITLPGITSTIVLMTILGMANILNGGFDQIYNMYTPAVYSTGDIIDTFVYRLGIDNAQFSLATAAGLFKSLISFIFISTSYGLAYKFANYRVF